MGTDISIDDKIGCIKREISMRRRVYPRWVEAGRMSQDKADREIATMEAILRDLEAERARQIPDMWRG